MAREESMGTIQKFKPKISQAKVWACMDVSEWEI